MSAVQACLLVLQESDFALEVDDGVLDFGDVVS